MADYKVTDTQLVQIADAIRSKGGTSASIVFPSGFISAVEAIPSWTSMSLISKEISENGTYLPSSDNADAFSSVVVDVPTGGGGGSNDNYLIAIGAKSGVINDSEAFVIGKFAFYKRNSSYGEPLTGIIATEVLSIGASAFEDCKQLTFVSFPKCTSVDMFAFAACTALESVSFPELKSAYGYAFSGCTALVSITLPQLEYIADNMFNGCYNLEYISTPKVKTIGPRPFSNCSKLSTLTFLEVNTIQSSAFYSMYKLKSLYILTSSVPALQNNVFNSTPMSLSSYYGEFGSIFVLPSLVESFRAASRWSVYADRITAYSES